MEHEMLKKMLMEKGLFSTEKMSRLLEYMDFVYEISDSMNLTGQKEYAEMVKVLLLKSIEPITKESVPRGTLFADMGTGAGFPGVPLGILFEESRGVLLDSVNKKTEFISRSLKELGAANMSAESVRLEEYGHGENREKFDLVVSRAMANPFMCLELGAPLLKTGGRMYLYSSLELETLHGEVLDHADILGMRGISSVNHCDYGFENPGILFVKKGETPLHYPRRFAKIKREAQRFDPK